MVRLSLQQMWSDVKADHALLIFEHVLFETRFSPQTGLRCGNRISDASFVMLSHSNYWNV